MKPILISIILVTNVLYLEIARNQDEKEIGLMYRKRWNSIDGMLFIYEKEQSVSYWMKNTYLPLVLFYMDSNFNILETYYPTPLSTDIISSKNSNVRYVLEFNPEKTNILFAQYREFCIKLKQKISKTMDLN